MNTARDGDTFTVVSLRSRTWWRNLRGERFATLRASGKQYAVLGAVVEKHDEVVAGLMEYFRQHLSYARFFGVRLAADGQPDRDDRERVASERVIIRLIPVTER